jgi:hypothetical protein
LFGKYYLIAMITNTILRFQAYNRARAAVILSAALLLSASLPRFAAFAADGVYFGANAGERPLSFLALPASAAALGRGSVSASGALDASDALRFPANTALAGGGQFFLGVGAEGEARALFAAAALPIFRDGALGVFTQSVPSAAFVAPNMLGVSFAKYFPEYSYGFGFSASFNRNDFWGEEELYGAFGADFRFDPAEFLSGRVYFSGAGMPIYGANAFNRRFAEQYGLIMNCGSYLDEEDFWKANIGIGVRKNTWGGQFEAGSGAEFIAGGRYIMRLGWEAPFGSIFRAWELAWDGVEYFMRHGYETPSAIDWRGIFLGWGAGLGIRLNGFGADAACRLGEGGVSWAANATFEVEEMKKRSAEANLALARVHYAGERFGKSRLYAARAMSEDTALWGAGPLYVKSEEELRRRAEGAVAFIYGGNSQGTVVPYPPSPEALGGLSRYAALVASLRRSYPVNFTVDVGNLLSAGKDAHRVEFAGGYYDAAKFDVLAPGAGELSMGAAKFAAAVRGKTPIIITNLNDNDAAATGIRGSVLLTNGGYTVYLINIVAGTVPDNGGVGNIDLSYNPEALKTQLSKGQAAGADLRMAVVHGTLDEVKRLTGELSDELDVVIAGSLEQRLDTPIKVGKTLIVSAGAENKFVGCLFVKFSGAKKAVKKGKAVTAAAPARGGARRSGPRVKSRFTAENALFPVGQEIEPDPAVENITKFVRAAIVVDRADGPIIRTRVRGVVAHLSDRGAGPQPFLKAAQSKSELPLGGDILYCRRPLLSSAGNRAAFIFGKPADKNGKLRMIDLEKNTSKTVSSGKNVLDAAFSPTDGFIYYIEADSGGDMGAIRKTKMYMNDAFTVLEPGAALRGDLHISSDGTTLLFASKYKGGKWDIYALDTSGKAAPVRLTDGKADHRFPRISPDGRYVAYISNRTGFGGKMDLWVYDRTTVEHAQLTVNTDVQGFTWGDDSEAIYFSAGANLLEICRVDMKYGLIRNIIPHPQGAVKTWSESAPMFMRYNDEPMLVYTRIYADGRRHIYWYDINRALDVKMYAVGEFNEWTE